jgi:hypothetical protein
VKAFITCISHDSDEIAIDIKDEKIWIQRNNTEINLADRLVEMGVVKEHIVIGFQSPFTRQFSGYAVG